MTHCDACPASSILMSFCGCFVIALFGAMREASDLSISTSLLITLFSSCSTQFAQLCKNLL